MSDKILDNLSKDEQQSCLGLEEYKIQLLKGLPNNTEMSDSAWQLIIKERLISVNNSIEMMYERMQLVDPNKKVEDVHSNKKDNGEIKTVAEVFGN